MAQTIAERKCEHCKAEKISMITMAPGHNGEAWWLCIPCWIDGVRPMSAPSIARAPELS